MEETITLQNRIDKEQKAINVYFQNFQSCYFGKTLYNNQDSYAELMSQIISLMNTFSGSLLTSAQKQQKQIFMKNLFKVCSDLLEKFKQQQKQNKSHSLKYQSRLADQYCKNCLQNLRLSNIASILEELKRNNDFGIESEKNPLYDTSQKSAPLFSQDEDLLFFEDLNKVLSMKEKILSLNESKIQYFLSSIDEFSYDLKNIAAFTETIKEDDLQTYSHSYWANYLNKEVNTFFKISFGQKIPKWIQKISSAFIKSYQNYRMKTKQQNMKSIGIQTYRKTDNDINIKHKIKNLQLKNKELERRLSNMKTFVVEKDQEKYVAQENLHYKLLESTFNSIKLEKQLKKRTNNSTTLLPQKKSRKTERRSQAKEQQNRTTEHHQKVQPEQMIEFRNKKKKLLTNFQDINVKRKNISSDRKSVTVIKNIQQNLFTKKTRESTGILSKEKTIRNSLEKISPSNQQTKINRLQQKKKLQKNKQTSSIRLQENNIQTINLSKSDQQLENNAKAKIERSSYALPKIAKKYPGNPSNNKIFHPQILSQLSTNRYFQKNTNKVKHYNNDQIEEIYHTLILSQLISPDISIQKFKDTLAFTLPTPEIQSYSQSPDKNRFSILNSSVVSVNKISPTKQKNSSHNTTPLNIQSPQGTLSGRYQIDWKELISEAKEKFKEQITQAKRDSVFSQYDLGLFPNKKEALDFEESLNKYYNKRQNSNLNNQQNSLMNRLIGTLDLIKKQNRKTYTTIVTYIQYPYQVMQNGFSQLNIISGISSKNFEVYFKKICWLHRKCQKKQTFTNRIQLILGKLLSQNHNKTERYV